MKVLVVDDSLSFRTQIGKAVALISGIQLIGTAAQANLALQLLDQFNPDLVLLDLEMPVMNGFEFLEAVRSRPQLKVVIFAGRTASSARDSERALSLGALDFILKPDEMSGERNELPHLKLATILEPLLSALVRRQNKALGLEGIGTKSMATESREAKPTTNENSANRLGPTSSLKKQPLVLRIPEAIVIASSTGGPPALEKLFGNHALQKPAFPVFIAQHMPPQFTAHLSHHLSSTSGLQCREAINGETAENGVVYIAPGDYHMRLTRIGLRTTIHLDQGPKVHNVRPTADHLFKSAAEIYKNHLCGIVLSGMGEDGCQGAAAIKSMGGQVMIQDRESSAVWGMPGAVHAAGSFDIMHDIFGCHRILALLCRGEKKQ